MAIRAGYDPMNTIKYLQDALVGDAILFKGMLDFSQLVFETNSLKKAYANKANFYVKLAARNFAEKRDKRGCWYKDGSYMLSALREVTIRMKGLFFKRKYVEGLVTVPKVNFTESKELYLATVLPHLVSKTAPSIIISQEPQPTFIS